jgi:hypothetical protein
MPYLVCWSISRTDCREYAGFSKIPMAFDRSTEQVEGGLHGWLGVAGRRQAGPAIRDIMTAQSLKWQATFFEGEGEGDGRSFADLSPELLQTAARIGLPVLPKGHGFKVMNELSNLHRSSPTSRYASQRVRRDKRFTTKTRRHRDLRAFVVRKGQRLVAE